MATKATIDKAGCKGCGLCVTVCPKKVIAISGKEINAQGYYPAEVFDKAGCIGCAFCAVMCPDCVITVAEEEV